jgi:hypothetical protein
LGSSGTALGVGLQLVAAAETELIVTQRFVHPAMKMEIPALLGRHTAVAT